MRWVPFDVQEEDIPPHQEQDIKPTAVQTMDELQIEQAIAREALRLAFEHHKQLAVGLKGVQQERSISDAFEQSASGQILIDMNRLHLIVGSGGILSHAPRRVQSMIMMIDSYQPAGVTHLSVDSIFMMPHLGVLSTVSEKAATDVFDRDCMVYLGAAICPVGLAKPGDKCIEYKITYPDGKTVDSLPFGEYSSIPCLSAISLIEAADPERFG